MKRLFRAVVCSVALVLVMACGHLVPDAGRPELAVPDRPAAERRIPDSQSDSPPTVSIPEATVTVQPPVASAEPAPVVPAAAEAGAATTPVAANPVVDPRIPIKARKHKLTLRNEYRRSFGLNMPDDAVITGAGTVHQESRWNPRAQSSHAQGLAQFTRPTWADVIQRDPSIAEIGDVWNERAAIRAMAVYHAWLWQRVPAAASELEHWAFVLSSYNGGLGNLTKDVRLCISPCDPLKWWGNVELKSGRAPEAFRENRGYPRIIWFTWRPMYAVAGF